jgi:hypothetical protein
MESWSTWLRPSNSSSVLTAWQWGLKDRRLFLPLKLLELVRMGEPCLCNVPQGIQPPGRGSVDRRTVGTAQEEDTASIKAGREDGTVVGGK